MKIRHAPGRKAVVTPDRVTLRDGLVNTNDCQAHLWFKARREQTLRYQVIVEVQKLDESLHPENKRFT